jgi:hypothetical protein
MAADLTGGLDPAREQVFAARPDDPEMRDSVSMWTVADDGSVTLPRIGIEAYASSWDQHAYQVNLAFPDGRAYRIRANGDTHPALGPEGEPTVLGAGPLAFRCDEPFRTWVMGFDGKLTQTSSTQLARGEIDGPLVDVAFEVTATMAVPPWTQGSLLPEAAERLANSVEGDLMGGPRYEQLYTATGSVRVDGAETSFRGSGLRIRRQGVRRLAAFWGHCWQSAVFPSGKAFGYIAYPPRADGEPTFNEGYVYAGDGELVGARVVQAPWLHEVRALGQDVSLALETVDGQIVRIAGETVGSTFDINHSDGAFDREKLKDFPALQQAGVRYTWDGEVSYGMLERSNPIGQLSFEE